MPINLVPVSVPVTLQSIVDLARESLNDDKTSGSDSACRYKDASLLLHANDGLDQIRNMRPDLFIGQFNFDGSQAVLTDYFPLSLRYKRALADYIIFRAESKDDDAVNSARVDLMAKLFTGELS